MYNVQCTMYNVRRTVYIDWKVGLKVLLLMVLVAAFTACENDLKKVEKIASNEASLPVETSKEVELIYSDSSIVRAKLITPVLKFYKVNNAYHEMPNGLFVEFYGANNRVESTLSAKYGRKFQNQGIIEVRDSVVVINEKGERLDTEKLIWNEKTKKIYTNSFVRITTLKDVMFGEGMEANQNFTNYRIYKYRGSVSLEENEQ
jgi:LPS export ABC transporter protein LptC